MHLRSTHFLSGIALLTLAVPGVRAADILWNSGVTGDYLTPANWQGGSLPTEADAAVIDSGTSNLNGGSSSVLRLRVGGAAGQTGNVNISNGAQYRTAEAPGGDLLIGDGGTGNVTITDSTFTVGRWLKVGLGGGTGTLTLSGTTEMELDRRPVQDPPLEEDEVWIGGDGNGSTGTLEMSGSSRLTSYSNVYIGVNNNTAQGTLNMSGSSEIRAWGHNNFLIGTGGATGHATLSGNAKIDKLNTLGGATGHFAVGIQAGSTGTLTMEDNAEIFTAGQFRVGAGGATGTLTMRDDARIEVANELWIGNASGSNGTVIMEGGTIRVDNWLAIGRQSGSGTLEMTGGLIELTGAIGGNLTTAALGAGVSATIEHSGGTIRNTATNTFLSENGTTVWTASGNAQGEFGRFVVNQGGVGAFFTIEGNANYTATTLAVKGGGEVNFDGGTFTADTLSVEAGGASPAVVNFNGGTVNIPRISIASGAVLETGTPFTVTNGRTLAGVGSGASTMMSDVTVAAGGTLSTHDTEIGQFLLEGVTLQTGAALEFDVNGLAPNDEMIVTSLEANGTIALTIHDLNAGSLETGVAYTLISGDLSGDATFDIEVLGGLALDESYGTGGYLFDTTAGTLTVQFAPIPEPGTVALIACGLTFAVWRLRRRNA